MKKILLTASCLLAAILANAQSPSFQWAKQMDGISGEAYGASVAVDNSGNVYTTGYFDGMVDFDPGTGTFYLSSATTDHDIFITKTDASGNFAWAKRIGGNYHDGGNAIAIDGSGNVYTAGIFHNTVDFDPGAGTFNLSVLGYGWGGFICKLDPSGNFVWAKAMTGSFFSTVIAGSIKIDGSGNIFTTGSFSDTVDFDPGAGVSLLTAGAGNDVFVSKLDVSGNFVWAKGFSGSAYDYGNSIAFDASGNVFTIGDLYGTTDFDPGAGVVNLTSAGGSDIFVSKLDAFGNFVWAKSFGGSSNEYGNSIAVDASGNVISTGYFSGTVDFDPGAAVFNLTSAGSTVVFISKLDASGNFVWAKSIGGYTVNSQKNALALDASGNIFTTGHFSSTVDFDPGAAVVNLTSVGGSDIFVSKLDASGIFVWAKNFGGSYSEYGNSIAVDASGNIFTTGIFSAPADFDPGGGTYNLMASGYLPAQFISKLNSSGNFVWARSAGNSAGATIYDIATDGSGNVFSTGYFYGTIDFDPGGGIYNLTSAGGSNDIFVCKSDASGNFVWVKQLGGTSGNDYGNTIAIDGSGNIYTAGYFYNTADFDPGAATYNLTSAGSSDVFISKLDASGNFVWAKRIGGTGNEEGNSIAIDASGNVLTTGNFGSTVDFDPGAGIYNLTSSGGSDAFISKLNAAGNFAWAKKIGGTGPAYGTSIATDASGSVFTTGDFQNTVDFFGIYNLTSSGGSDVFISKLDASGNFVWAEKIGDTGPDHGTSIATDASGSVFITGDFQNIVYFFGLYSLTSSGGSDVFISKLDAAGNFVWAKRIGGIESDAGNAVATDGAGNVYITGYIESGIYLGKIDAPVTIVWEITLNGSAAGSGNSIAVDVLNNIYTAGSFSGVVDFDPNAGIYNLTPLGDPDAFIQKMSQCTPPVASITPGGATTFCSGSSVILNANTGAGLSYQWKNNGADISGATNLFYSTTAAGSYTVVVTNPCGSATSSAVTVTVNVLPSSIIAPAGPTTFCSGSSVVLNAPTGSNKTYQWKKGANLISGATLSSYTATTGGSYRVIVTNTVTGCSKTTGSATIVTINPLPTATITPQGPTTFCAGGSVVLAANTGAGLTYKWKKGNNYISGATLSNYTAAIGGAYKVQVTNSNGCSKLSAGVVVSVPCKLSESEGESENAFDVNVYPNPSSGDFTFEFENTSEEKISIHVYDVKGKLVLSESIHNLEFIIHHSKLAPGIYSAVIINGENEKVLKLVKTNYN